MEKSNVPKPITTTLNGSNYNLWVLGMKSFLIGRKLWRIVTGDIRKPTKAKDETNEKFVERVEDWDCKNHQIIAWFRNTSIPSVQAKISEDHLQLIQVLMALRPEYEVVRASLLQRHPLPSLDAAIQEIFFEETHLNLDKTPQFDTTLATTRSSHQKPRNHLVFWSHLKIVPYALQDLKLGSENHKQCHKACIPSITAAATESSTAITCRIHKRNRFLGLVKGWVDYLSFNLSIFLKICVYDYCPFLYSPMESATWPCLG
ncbi:hypothetical protein SESBI_21016 [Sesbania bispinosa]|nr:hypothetical protein SESBI_21016 [Sesbania bispinosa]